MSKSEILGLLDYEDQKKPFVFYENLLIILPDSESDLKMRQSKMWDEIVKDLNEAKGEKKWIENKYISGITNENKHIIFLTKGSKSIDNGIIKYNIQSFYKYDIIDNESDKINEIILSADEIDLFYNPSRIFNSSIYYGDKKTEKIVVDINCLQNKEEELGSYEYNGERIYLNLGIQFHLKSQAKTPLNSYSYFHLRFEKEKQFDEVLIIINHIYNLLSYVHYRKNIRWEYISVIKDVEGIRKSVGSISILNNKEIEKNKKKESCFIKYEYIKNNILSFLSEISQNKMYLQHIHKSIDDRYKLDVNRIIIIFAAFEREFRNYYSDFKRSEEYYEIKNGALDILKSFKNKCRNRRERKYIERFVEIINNSDYSLGTNIKHSINDCLNIMEIFIQYHYASCDDSVINSISSRINILRNNVAHGKLDFKIEPINVTDIQILETLLYAIRLKPLEIDDNLKKKAIADLFGYNIAI